jgi:putative membrane protein
MNSPKRLHPVAAVLRFLRSLRELAIPLFIFIFIGGRGEDRLFDQLYFIGITAIIVGMLIYGILSWFRFTYRVEAEELRIEYGVIVTKKRYIPLERIQTIDVSSGVIQRLFGLVKVQVETAGGGDEAEAVLSAITSEEAELLRMALSMKKNSYQQNEEEEVVEQFTVSTRDLFIMASTSGGIGVVISALFAFLTQVDELLPYDYIYGIALDVIGSGFLIFAIGMVMITFFAWIISIVSTSFKFGNYKLLKKGNNLLISRGLLEKRELTIPINRVHAVRVQESIVRQLLGYAGVYIEVAGGSMDKKEDFSTVLLPIVRTKDVEKLLSKFTPDFVMEKALQPLPERAKKRYILRLLLPSFFVVAIMSYFLNPWGYISIVLLPLAVFFSLIMHREAGWKVMGNRLLLRYRFINRHTVYARKNRIQAFHLIHSYFQRNAKLASIVVSTQSKMSGKHFKVVDVDGEHALQLYKWYSYEKKQPL